MLMTTRTLPSFLKASGPFLAVIGVWLGVIGQAGAQEKPIGAKDRPNIILILADDLGISEVGCYGGDRYQTPHLDQLAKTGLRFQYCYSTPLCGPSRALLLTGRYGFRTGAVGQLGASKMSPEKETTIAQVLRRLGYATAVIGKWPQLTFLETRDQGRAWGFDEFMIWNGFGTPDRYWSPKYNKNGKVQTGGEKDYGPDQPYEFAVDFMTRHREQPFFVYYPTPLIHFPVVRTPDSLKDSKDLLADNVAYLDKLVGKLVADLDRLGLRERTVIIFTGDNGPQLAGLLNGRRVLGAKGSLTEGGCRVPLIVNWKGTTPAGKVPTDLIDFSDFFVTLAELAGADRPKGVTLDGQSFAPQIRGQAGKPRDWVHVQLDQHRFVRDAHWKLTDEGKLYDMKEAPFQETLVTNENDAAKSGREKLQKALDKLR